MAIERDLRLISPQKNRHQAVFLFCRPLFQGFLQLLDLALVLGNFLKAGGNLLLDRFLADFGHLACSFCSDDTCGVGGRSVHETPECHRVADDTNFSLKITASDVLGGDLLP